MKYKLIKKYPGCIFDLNDIINLKTICWLGQDFLRNIKNYPEFWELVVEKDYKILSLARFCSIKPTITNVSDYGDEFVEAMLKCDRARIHSVIRLYDGEIFTIGDTIANMCDSKQKISELYICKDSKMCVYTSTTCRFTINNIKKVKQPLFTTEQRSEIEEIIKNIIK